MKNTIGNIAGKIWETLRKKEELNIVQLSKIHKEKMNIIYQAVGWLAREDKINFRVYDGKIFVSLTDAERNISFPEKKPSRTKN